LFIFGYSIQFIICGYENNLLPPLFSHSYHSIPFTEDWEQGSFLTNHWSAGQNWKIDNSAGNPGKCAEVSSNVTITQTTLVNHYGQAVYSNNGVKSRSILIDIENLPPGVYFLIVDTEAGVKREKVVVEH